MWKDIKIRKNKHEQHSVYNALAKGRLEIHKQYLILRRIIEMTRREIIKYISEQVKYEGVREEQIEYMNELRQYFNFKIYSQEAFYSFLSDEEYIRNGRDKHHTHTYIVTEEITGDICEGMNRIMVLEGKELFLFLQKCIEEKRNSEKDLDEIISDMDLEEGEGYYEISDERGVVKMDIGEEYVIAGEVTDEVEWKMDRIDELIKLIYN